MRLAGHTLFLSVEPMLTAIEIGNILYPPPADKHIGRIAQVICGAETGPRRRLMKLAWAQSLLKQCRRKRVAFFIKRIPEGIPDDLMVREMPT
jgi:protein gp37